MSAKGVLRSLEKALVEGLLVLLPILLSLYAAYWIFSLFYRLFGLGLVFIPKIYQGLPWARPLATAATAIVTAAAILATGIAVRTVIGRRLARMVEAAIASVPLTRSLFQAFRQLLHMLFSKPAADQARVVLVPFPHKRSYAIGLVTGPASERLSGQKGVRHFKVFVPATPNPTSGYLMLVPEGDLVPTGLSVDQALRITVSGGLLVD